MNAPGSHEDFEARDGLLSGPDSDRLAAWTLKSGGFSSPRHAVILDALAVPATDPLASVYRREVIAEIDGTLLPGQTTQDDRLEAQQLATHHPNLTDEEIRAIEGYDRLL